MHNQYAHLLRYCVIKLNEMYNCVIPLRSLSGTISWLIAITSWGLAVTVMFPTTLVFVQSKQRG